MGSGEARELGGSIKASHDLNQELSARLGAALTKLDQADPEFKQARDDERLQQQSKTWKALCKDMDVMMRELAFLLINTHQVGLDVGSSGGGRDTRPFFEELSGKFPRLEYRLQESTVVAVCNNRGIAQTDMNGVTFEWIEQSAVTWMVWLIEQGGQ